MLPIGNTITINWSPEEIERVDMFVEDPCELHSRLTVMKEYSETRINDGRTKVLTPMYRTFFFQTFTDEHPAYTSAAEHIIYSTPGPWATWVHDPGKNTNDKYNLPNYRYLTKRLARYLKFVDDKVRDQYES